MCVLRKGFANLFFADTEICDGIHYTYRLIFMKRFNKTVCALADTKQQKNVWEDYVRVFFGI